MTLLLIKSGELLSMDDSHNILRLGCNSVLSKEIVTEVKGTIIIEGINVTLRNIVATNDIIIQNSSHVNLTNCGAGISIATRTAVSTAPHALIVENSTDITFEESTFKTPYYQLIPDGTPLFHFPTGKIDQKIMDLMYASPIGQMFLRDRDRKVPSDILIMRSSRITFNHCGIGITPFDQTIPYVRKSPLRIEESNDVTFNDNSLLISPLFGVDNISTNVLFKDSKLHMDRQMESALIIYRVWKRYRASKYSKKYRL